MATVSTTQASNLMRYRSLKMALREVCDYRLCVTDDDCCAGGCCALGTRKCYDPSFNANNCPLNIPPLQGLCHDELFNC